MPACLATALVLGLLWQSYQRYHVVAEASVENTTLSLERFLGAHFRESELALLSAAEE